MSEDSFPTGKRFSLVYLERDQIGKDSNRFRHRLASFLATLDGDRRDNFARLLSQELGVSVPYRSSGYYDFQEFFENAELRDILDSITLYWSFIASRQSNDANKWYEFVSRAFREESLGYRLDERCGVHYLVDQTYEAIRNATLRNLEQPNYLAVKESFENCQDCFDQDAPDTKGAVRSIFESVEILFKLIVDNDKVNRINANYIESHLRPIVTSRYAGNDIAVKATDKYLDSFSDWVNAIHNLRHGQKVNEPSPLPLDLAVALVSSGTAYLRWLIEIDQLHSE